MEPGTDRCMAASDLPRPSQLARVSRADLSGAVSRRKGRIEKGTHPPVAHWSPAEEATAVSPSAPHPVHLASAADRSPTSHRGAAHPAWRLGGRPDHRQVQPVSYRPLVDRTSRYVRLVHLPGGHSAAELRAAMTLVMDSLTARVLADPDMGPRLRDGAVVADAQ